MNYPNILERNVYSSIFKGKFLLAGSCLVDMYPDVFTNFEKEWKNIVTICLERDHYNQMISKLYGILEIGNTKKVCFLTVDGSPHCVQVHFASKYLKRTLGNKVVFKHYVINKKREVFQVSIEAIDKSRNLALVGKRVYSAFES